jgi:hypothetical protein
MKLPIQAQPISRKVGTSNALMSGITASECNWHDCGEAALACTGAAAFGMPAFGACLATWGAGHCAECYWKVVTTGPGCDSPGRPPCE